MPMWIHGGGDNAGAAAAPAAASGEGAAIATSSSSATASENNEKPPLRSNSKSKSKVRCSVVVDELGSSEGGTGVGFTWFKESLWLPLPSCSLIDYERLFRANE